MGVSLWVSAYSALPSTRWPYNGWQTSMFESTVINLRWNRWPIADLYQLRIWSPWEARLKKSVRKKLNIVTVTEMQTDTWEPQQLEFALAAKQFSYGGQKFSRSKQSSHRPSQQEALSWCGTHHNWTQLITLHIKGTFINSLYITTGCCKNWFIKLLKSNKLKSFLQLSRSASADIFITIYNTNHLFTCSQLEMAEIFFTNLFLVGDIGPPWNS